MKKILNKNTFLIAISFATGLCLSTSIFAATMISSKLVSYSNTKTEKTTVSDAVDELYDKAIIGDATENDIVSGKTALVNGKLVTGKAKTYEEGLNEGKSSPYINISNLITSGNGSAGGINDMRLYTGDKCKTLKLGPVSGGSNLYSGGAYIRALNSSGGVLTTFWTKSWSAASNTNTLSSGGTFNLPSGTHYVQLYSYSNATDVYPKNTITWSSIVIE